MIDPMLVAAYLLLVIAAVWAVLGLYVGIVLAYDEITHYQRVAPNRGVTCPDCGTVRHPGACPPLELPTEPLRPTLRLQAA